VLFDAGKPEMIQQKLTESSTKLAASNVRRQILSDPNVGENFLTRAETFSALGDQKPGSNRRGSSLSSWIM
jgi:hypothetical protein